MKVIELVSEDFGGALDLLRSAGFRLDMIYPADDPQSAVLTHGDREVRLSAPGASALPEASPEFAPRFVLTRAGGTSGEGRAGMLYRDLIPDRLGGRYIASHVTIPAGGPVADWVHFHRILVQMIVVRRGWVRVVYEDQGNAFVLNPGDLVYQPPGIRHRVLESSDGLEVIEVGAPALHATFAEHGLELPNGRDPSRSFEGQRFLRHVAVNVPWIAADGVEVQQTGLAIAANGRSDARFIRPAHAAELELAPHDGELSFCFVMDGQATLHCSGEDQVGPADSFVIPPDQAWRLTRMSADFRLLHVSTAQLD